MVYSRRAVLHLGATTVLPALAGCAGFTDSLPPQGSFVIENEDTSKHIVSVIATSSFEVNIKEGFIETIQGGQTETKQRVIQKHGTYEVQVKLESGASSMTSMGLTTHDGPGHYLIIRISNGGSLELIRKRSG